MPISTRTALASACLIVGPLAAVGYELVTPIDTGSNYAHQIAQAAAHPGAMNASAVFDFLGLALIPAVLLVAALARPGAPRLAAVGGAVAFAGYIGLTIVTAGDALLKAAAGVPDRTAAAALVHAYWATGLVGAMLAVYLVGHIAGVLLLAAALWRSRAVPRWAALALAVLPLFEVVEQAGNIHLAGALGYALVAASFAACARALGGPRALPAGPRVLDDLAPASR
jgi:hypothetical protein